MPVEERGLSTGGALAGAGGSPPALGESEMGAGATGAGASGAGAGAGFDAAGFATGATGTTPSLAKAALSLRATGGSMVEDGPLTNSPISFSFSRARFESIPNSAAISCTRGFPATILLSGHSQSGRASTYKRDSFRAAHEVSISHSACSYLRSVDLLSSSTAEQSRAGPCLRALFHARRWRERFTQSDLGCTQAPRPCSRPRSSTTTLLSFATHRRRFSVVSTK